MARERKMVWWVLLAGVVALCAGCTSLGPFVTDVSRDKSGNLVVEKSQLELNTITGDMKFVGQTKSVIRMNNAEQQQ